MFTAVQLKALLREQGLRLTKRLGQHYLVDARAIERIIEACELSREDTVVEIGAGLGALTEPLAQRAGSVIAIEVDRAISAILRERLALLTNVTVKHQDILDFAWGLPVPRCDSGFLGRDPACPGARQRQAREAQGRGMGLHVVGAIPYHITSPILVSLCEARQAIRQAVLLLQDEVARRLVAGPGTKAYGRLSVLTQYYWEVHRLFAVPRSAFFPQPDVDSACLRLVPRAKPPAAVGNERLFFDIVKAAFSQRRKTLMNCLTGLLGREGAKALLKSLGWPDAVRGEALSLDQFAQLANHLSR